VVTGKLDVRAAAASLPQDELPSALETDALDTDAPMTTVTIWTAPMKPRAETRCKPELAGGSGRIKGL
jgi:hypothetical protein